MTFWIQWLPKRPKRIPEIVSDFHDIKISLEIPKTSERGFIIKYCLKKSKDQFGCFKLANLIVETLKFHLIGAKIERLWDNVNVAKPGFVLLHKFCHEIKLSCAAVAETYYGWGDIKKMKRSS